MKWSVVVTAEGDRAMTREEIVDLADAVAVHQGIASGIGAMSYGAQLVVEADSRRGAESVASSVLRDAAESASLPNWPVEVVSAVSEEEDAQEGDRW